MFTRDEREMKNKKTKCTEIEEAATAILTNKKMEGIKLLTDFQLPQIYERVASGNMHIMVFNRSNKTY